MKKTKAKMLEISDTTSANLYKINASYVSTGTAATNHIKFNFGNFNFKLFNIKNYTAGDPEDRKAMIILMTNSGKKTIFTSEASNYDGVLTILQNM